MSALQDAVARGDWRRAASHLERALARRPRDPALALAMGSILRNQFRFDTPRENILLRDADHWYGVALSESPRHAEAAAERASLGAELYHAEGADGGHYRSTEEVANLFHAAIELQPRNAALYRRLGQWLVDWDNGRHDVRLLADTAVAFGTALRLEPDSSPETALQLGLVQHRRGRWADAEGAYASALRMRPSYAEAYGLLGSLRFHRDRQLGAAEHALRASLALRRQEEAGPAARADSPRAELTQVLQLQGRLEEAAALLGGEAAGLLGEAAAAGSSTLPRKLSAGWSMQNELALPMHLWRHYRAGLLPDHLRLPGLLASCGGLPANATRKGLLGCNGDCVRRSTTVELWQACKRHLGWPIGEPRPNVISEECAEPVSATVAADTRRGGWPLEERGAATPGAPAGDSGSAVHLAARWGMAWEVEALVLSEEVSEESDHATPSFEMPPTPGPSSKSSSASSPHSFETMLAMLQPEGPLMWTPAHEAAVRADCAVLTTLLDRVGHRSPAALEQLLSRTDAFGRSASELVHAARPAHGPCLLASLERAAAVSRGARPVDATATAGRVRTSASTASSSSNRPPLVSASAIEAALAAAATDPTRRVLKVAGPSSPSPSSSSSTSSPSSSSSTSSPSSSSSSAAATPRDSSEATGAQECKPSGGMHECRDSAGLRANPASGWLEPPPHHPVHCDVDVWNFAHPVSTSSGAGRSEGRAKGKRQPPVARSDVASPASLRAAARFVRDAVSLDRPVLLRGLLTTLPGKLEGWTREELLAAAGDETFQVMQFDVNGSGEMTDSHTWRRVALREWLQEMRGARPQQPMGWRRQETSRPPAMPPPLLPEYIFDQAGGASRGALGSRIQRLFPWRALLHSEAPGLYMGANGSGNPFHYHQQTWNALVAGRKHWLLYPPNASFYSELHPLEWLRRGQNGTSLPPPIECIQQAGDVLFVPRLWGHGTINLGESVGVAMPFSLRHGVDYAGALQLGLQ